jgi:hypothetical protein
MPHKLKGNMHAHQLGVVRASDSVWLVKPTVDTAVDMAACTTDMLGFCYTAAFRAPVSLLPGEMYYILSSEVQCSF